MLLIFSNISYLCGNYEGDNKIYKVLEDIVSESDDLIRILEKNKYISVDKEKQQWINDRDNALKDLEKKYKGLSFTTIMNQGDYINIIIKSVLSSILLGAVLAISMSKYIDITISSIITSAIISALTVTGKAIFKTVAVKKADNILFIASKLMSIFDK